MINYNYAISLIPSNFLTLTLTEVSSSATIFSVASNGPLLLTIKDSPQKIVTGVNTFAASYFSSTLLTFADSLGQLDYLLFDPDNPTSPQVLGFFINDDGTVIQYL